MRQIEKSKNVVNLWEIGNNTPTFKFETLLKHDKNIFFVASCQKKAHICLPDKCVLFSTKFALRASEIALL